MATNEINGIGTGGSNSLWHALMYEDILPGHMPSYILCKLIFTSHPLGAKIAHWPVEMALSETREIRVDAAADDEPAKEFMRQWAANGCDDVIAQVGTKARIYGMSAMVFGAVDPQRGDGGEVIDPEEDIPLNRLHELDIYFNVVDPLNTGGSLTLDQNPNNPDFLKSPGSLRVNGQKYGKGRFVVLMNEGPEYLDFENSTLGYTGRSAFRRCVYPLRSYLETQVANNQVAHKAGVLIAKIKNTSSVANRAMQMFSNIKAETLRIMGNENVLTIGTEESIESLNLMNVDGSLAGVRRSIIEDIAAAATMPAQILNSQTLAQGFGEGTEDAKQIANYIRGRRRWLKPVYDFCDVVTMRRAWTPAYIRSMKQRDPEQYGTKSEETIFQEWRDSFSAQWPSENEDSEAFEVTEKRMGILLDTIKVILSAAQGSPDAVAGALEYLQDNINNTGKNLFSGELNLDTDSIRRMTSDELLRDAGEPAELGSAGRLP